MVVGAQNKPQLTDCARVLEVLYVRRQRQWWLGLIKQSFRSSELSFCRDGRLHGFDVCNKFEYCLGHVLF